MIHATPRISPALTTKLVELDALRSQLAHELGVAQPWSGLLRRDALIESVTSSASIEGYEVEPRTAHALMDRALPAAGDESQWAVACYARAMEHIAVMSDDPAFRWLDRVLLDLHFDACSFQRDRSPGRWRTGPVSVTGSTGRIEYAAPEGERVPALMAEVVDWLQYGDLRAHVAVRAAMAHLHVASVHPFRDGNGRVSRLVQSLVLARDGVLAPALGSIEPHLATNTASYYAHLQDAHGAMYEPERDATAWVEFCIDAHIAQASARIALVSAAGKRWAALERLVLGKGWPDRLVIALEQALAGSTDRGRYVAEADVSLPAASLDFRRLVDADLLDVRGSGRRTRYVASSRLRGLLLDGPS